MGDQLAGRVVLQALIGRMVRMAQRDPRAGIDDYLARLWCVINSYPLIATSRADRGKPLDGHPEGSLPRTPVHEARRHHAVE